MGNGRSFRIGRRVREWRSAEWWNVGCAFDVARCVGVFLYDPGVSMGSFSLCIRGGRVFFCQRWANLQSSCRQRWGSLSGRLLSWGLLGGFWVWIVVARCVVAGLRFIESRRRGPCLLTFPFPVRCACRYGLQRNAPFFNICFSTCFQQRCQEAGGGEIWSERRCTQSPRIAGICTARSAARLLEFGRHVIYYDLLNTIRHRGA